MARKSRQSIEGVLPACSLSVRSVETYYYQVEVGSMGVVLPSEINLETLSGITLVAGKASVIEDEGLAKRVASVTGGKIQKVYECYSVNKLDIETRDETRGVKETVSVNKFMEVLRGKDY
ncbi:hypothetical protein [Bacillus phage SPO1L4]|nr:hypothetical protein Goe9_c00390 [Bacillus phage vB_BsuM-Goe9]WIT26372.1 hypothetical protein [Bacillus phage SPO1L3]WIT26571.1 hypothetical protein [Bacillus phage SPO1L4]WIT26770.1 hypothetical protein [Bacillus phage SPO1L5]